MYKRINIRHLFGRIGWLSSLVAASWGQVLSAVVSLVSIRYYTSSLDAIMFGNAMLLLGILTFADGIIGMAFSQTLNHLSKEEADLNARLNLGLGFCLLFLKPAFVAFAFSSVVFVMFCVFAYYNESYFVVLVAFLFYMTLEPFRICGQVNLVLSRHYTKQSIWMACDSIVAFISTMIFIRYFSPNVVSLLVGLVCGRVTTTVVAFGILFGWRSLFNSDLTRARLLRKKALSFALPVSAMAPLGWASLYIDRYAVSIIAGPASAGLLAALSGSVTRPFSIISAALTNYFRPDMLDHAAGRTGVHGNPLRAWIIIAGISGIIGVCIIAVFSKDIANFLIKFRYGSEYAPLLLVLLASSQVLVLLTHAVDNFLLAAGKSRALLFTQTFAVMLGLPMVLIGAVFGGVIGAAIGRIANEFIKLIFASYLAMFARAGRTLKI